MKSTSIIAQRLRLASLLALGSFDLHQLRYLLAYGGDSGQTLAEQGHDYLASALPVLAALALAALLATALRARLGAGLSRRSLSRRILLCATALLAIYAGQELLEGTLSAGHPAGAAAVLASPIGRRGSAGAPVASAAPTPFRRHPPSASRVGLLRSWSRPDSDPFAGSRAWCGPAGDDLRRHFGCNRRLRGLGCWRRWSPLRWSSSSSLAGTMTTTARRP